MDKHRPLPEFKQKCLRFRMDRESDLAAWGILQTVPRGLQSNFIIQAINGADIAQIVEDAAFRGVNRALADKSVLMNTPNTNVATPNEKTEIVEDLQGIDDALAFLGGLG